MHVWGGAAVYKTVVMWGIVENTFLVRLLRSRAGLEQIINESYVFGKKYSASISFDNFSVYFSLDDIPLNTSTFGQFDIDELYIKDMIYNPSTKKYHALIIEDKTSSFIYEYSENMEFIRKSFITESLPIESLSLSNCYFQLNPLNDNLYLETSSGSFEIDKNNLTIVNSFLKNTSNSIYPTLRGNILFTYDISNYSL